MADYILLAWATPLNTETLGASLEAYVDSRLVIHVLNLCVRYGQVSGAPIGKLPQELVDRVAEHIYEPLFDNAASRWANYQRCCDNVCTPSDHFNESEIDVQRAELVEERAKYGYYDDYDSDDLDAKMEDWIDSRKRCLRHGKRLHEYLDMFDGSMPMSDHSKKFRRCRKIFASDFKLELHFAVQRRWDRGETYPRVEDALVLSYMILPSPPSEIWTRKGPGVVSYLSTTVIEPSTLLDPTDEQKSRFKAALSSLKLKPFANSSQHATRFLNSFTAREESIDFISTQTHRDYRRKNIADERHLIDLGVGEAFDWPKLTMLTSGTMRASHIDYCEERGFLRSLASR